MAIIVCDGSASRKKYVSRLVELTGYERVTLDCREFYKTFDKTYLLEKFKGRNVIIDGFVVSHACENDKIKHAEIKKIIHNLLMNTGDEIYYQCLITPKEHYNRSNLYNIIINCRLESTIISPKNGYVLAEHKASTANQRFKEKYIKINPFARFYEEFQEMGEIYGV